MRKSFWITLVLFLLLPVVVFAQGVTTGAFSGKVVDTDGNPVLAAEIVIVHAPTGTRYVTLTRADGRFDVPGVRVGGPYTITASYQGFKTEKKDDLVVKLGETKDVNFKLQLATIDAGEVVVTATDAVMNPYRTGASQNVAQASIENLPTISRSLSDFTRLSPQMVPNDETDGSFTAGGRSSRYNNVQIDGAQNNDLFGLGSTGTPGGQSEATPISIDAVQEFQIVLAPYDVRQGMFTGGGVNIITKSGTNQFHGTAFWEGRNENFVGEGISEKKFNEFSETTFGASIGGPIIENKLFFFLNAESHSKKTPQDYYIDGSGNDYDFGHQAEADQFISIMQGFGYDTGGYGEVTNERKNTKLFGRIDWNLSDKHRLTLRHNYVKADLDSLLRNSATTFYFGNAGVIYKNKTNSTVLQLNSVLGESLHNELIINYTTIRDNPTYMGEAFPKIQVTIPGGITFHAGAEEYRHKNILKQDLIELTDTFTLYKGKHTLLFGTHNEFFKFYNVYVKSSFGKYEFRSLADLAARRVYRYDRFYSLNDDPNAPAEFNVYQLGLYVGDEWAVTPNLTLTLGLRADVPLMPKDPDENPLVFSTFGIPTNHNAGGNLLWSPRVGFNFDVTGDQSLQARGGIGIFSGRTPYVWISNQYSNTGTLLGEYLITNPGFFITDPNNQPENPVGGAAAGDINLIAEDYKFPQVLKMNIAIDKELPFGFIGTVEFVYSKSINEIKYQNINLAPTGQTNAFDGRPLYGTQSTSGTARYGTPNRVSRGFYNVLLLENTDEGFQYTLSFQLQKEWNDGSMVNASYTYGMAKDLFSGTSSQAISNWRYNNTDGDPNNPSLGYSSFDTRHRIVFAMTKRFDFFKSAPTYFSIFYNGRSGHPYSTIYFNDVNGDNQANDLIWVPASADDVIMTRGTWEELDAYIKADPGLDKYRGQIVPRNASRDPWTHLVDLKVSQAIPIPGLKGHKLELFVTMANFLNLFDKDWGVYRYIDFDDSPLTFMGYDTATGKPKFDFYGKNGKNQRYTVNQVLSRWKALFGIKYRF